MRTFNSGNPNVARVTATRTAGTATLTVDNLAGWPTATGVSFSTYKIDTNNKIIAGSQTDWNATVTSSTTLGNMTRVTGAADAGHTIGDVVEMNPTADWADKLVRAFINEHSQLTGAHTAITANSVTSSGAVSGTTGTFSSDVSDNGVTITTVRSETFSNFVASGGVIAQTSGLTGSFSNIVYYINGRRYTVSSVANRTYTASTDTYVDIGISGTVTYTAVANGVASPALAANSIRVAKVITSGAAITSVVQTGSDSLGNIIYPINTPVSSKQLQNPNKFSAYSSSATSIAASSVYTKVQFQTENFDTGSNFDSVTNYRFVAPVAGFYYFNTTVILFVANTIVVQAAVYKNGAILRASPQAYNGTGGNNNIGSQVQDLVFLAANDYIEVFARSNQGSTCNTVTGADNTYFSGFLVSAV